MLSPFFGMNESLSEGYVSVTGTWEERICFDNEGRFQLIRRRTLGDLVFIVRLREGKTQSPDQALIVLEQIVVSASKEETFTPDDAVEYQKHSFTGQKLSCKSEATRYALALINALDRRYETTQEHPDLDKEKKNNIQ